jgi:gliding motility-associated-like protein
MHFLRLVHMNRFIWLLLLFSLTGQSLVYADNQSIRNKMVLPPPIWSCIQTVGGDVVLNWQPVSDPGGNFISYEVHSVEDGLIATIPNIATTTYTHVGVSSVKNYFISVIDNVVGATNSVTLQNIRLTLNNPNNGTALLSWNQSGFPLPSPPATPVNIEKEYPAGVWNTEKSVPSNVTFFRDTIDVCQAQINYQIVHPGNGCDFTSNVIGDVFEDKITPDIPVISNTTIDTMTGNVVISWNANAQPDTYGYVVYLVDASGFLVEIDTVWGQANTTFNYVENTSTGPLTYSVAAFDSCFTASVPATYQTSAKADVHTTVFLSGVYSGCGSFATLYWTNYEGWDIDHFEFFYHDPNQNWVSVPNLNVNQYTMVLPNTAVYEFVVQAHHTDGRTSFSNVFQLTATASSPPSINYITSATVVNQKVNLRHLVDTSGNVTEVAFEWMQKDGSFKEVGRVPAFTPFNNFIHEDADVEKVNTYRAVIIDSCGNQTIISDTVHTTVLEVIGDSVNLTNTLNWSPYIGFDGGVIDYEIYRSIDGIVDPMPIATVAPGTYTYLDYVSEEIVRNTLCYHIVAIEDINQYAFAETANSNVRCSEFSATVYIPTAFTPNGFNPVFRPEYSYMKYPNFYMWIYDRWGQVIFETDNAYTGWDGTMLNGSEDAPNDTYRYLIRFYGIDDLEMIYTGHFSLLR